MKDQNAMPDIKERYLKYSAAVLKYCQSQSRKTPFVKNSLRLLQEATAKDTASTENMYA